MKNIPLQFDSEANHLTGPAGSLAITPSDHLARRFLMLVEGQCLESDIATVARKYGYCRQRYYQILDDFKEGGLSALQLQKTCPKSNYRRTDQIVRLVLRYRFLDPDASPEVVVQKLRQDHFSLSLRSVHRIIADYGLQKKTLRPQPGQEGATGPAERAKHPAPSAVGRGRTAQRRTGGSSTAGR